MFSFGSIAEIFPSYITAILFDILNISGKSEDIAIIAYPLLANSKSKS